MINNASKTSPDFIYMDKGVGERIASIRRETKLNQQDFGQLIGVGIAKMNRLERGHIAPDAELLLAIRHKFGCDLNWLLTGQEVSELLDGSLPLMTNSDLRLKECKILIPDLPKDCFAVKIQSDDMVPVIRPGDIVVYREQQTDFKDGGLVLYESSWGEVRVRRYRHDPVPRLCAEDQTLPSFTISEDYQVVGIVLQVIRQLIL